MTSARAAETSPASPDGLRERKRRRTHDAIQEAALDLFEEQGYESTTIQQIADRAEVAPATLFRYFPSKAELLVGDLNLYLAAVVEELIDRPPEENGLVAIRHAIIEQWAPRVDPTTTARRSRIIASSDLLSGLSYHRGLRWLGELSDALAQRQGVPLGDERCLLITRIALAAMAAGVEGWVAGDFQHDLTDAIAASFDLTAEIFVDLSRQT